MIRKALIIFLWILHLSALIGLALDYKDFFLTKSPFTLLYLAIVLWICFPIQSLKKIGLFIICFTVGMLTEWIGVHTGSLFGDYYYGENLGPKLDGIPYLIGVNWAILAFISHAIAQNFIKNVTVKTFTAAGLMVILDFFLEQICDYAGYWHFNGGAGWWNYVCWFLIAAVLHTVLAFFKLQGDRNSSLHLYAAQLIFAIGLWIIITI
ncbi:conserved hypothetical transmembrane protein [Flavobacteria bacterium BBFL7]|nr:conserved hypothetical transmembrane protein [Flavobacteria bacterium BBFL7]